MASGPITSWQIDGGKMERVTDFILGGSKIAADSDCSHEIKRCLLLGRKAMTNLDSVFESRDITFFTNKGPSSQSYDFSSSHIWMWELDYKESWAPKNWCFWTVGLEKTLEIPLDCKEVKSVHPKGDESWLFIGRSDAKAETPILGVSMRRIDSLQKTLMLGGIEGGRRRGQEDEMAGWHHQYNGHEFEQAPGVGDRQGSLVCCSQWGHKESDMTERLNWTESLEGLMLKLSSNILATWWEELTHWKRPWGWDRLKAKGERGGRRWDG